MAGKRHWGDYQEHQRILREQQHQNDGGGDDE